MAGRYLVEIFAPAANVAETLDAAWLAVTGSVRILEVIVVPADETCFLVVVAPDERTVVGALRGSGLQVNRVSLTVDP